MTKKFEQERDRKTDPARDIYRGSGFGREKPGSWHANNSVSQRLASITGIGVLTATALADTDGEGLTSPEGQPVRW
jgi:hypothetical protein